MRCRYLYFDMLINLLIIYFASVIVNANESPCSNEEKPVGSTGTANAKAYSSSSSSGSQSSSYAYASSYASASTSDCDKGDFNDCKGDRNATYKRCPNPCPRTCQNPQGVKNCYKACQRYGCECKNGYVLSDNRKCVLLKDCPAYFRCGGDRNTTYQECPSACPRTCEYPGGKGVCTAQCLKEGCQCKDGYLLDANGKCVQLQDCSGAKKCSANETFVYCKVGCPTNNCPLNDGLGMVACSPPFPCRSGCSCKADYFRDGSANDRCIKSSDCPPVNCTRPNEEWNPRIPPCPFNRCSDIGKPNECNRPYSYSRPQCTCKKGFYYNDDNVCVPKEECPYFRCGGDRNTTYQECPSACPRTCEYPGGKGVCTAQCLKEGCQCKDGYLLDANGKCVQLQDCSGAKKCSANETFVYCKVGCPTNNCPLNDGLGMVACSPPFPCRSGCSCKADFLRDGSANDRCIKSSDCPPVNCTRPNEEWNPRIPPCPFNRCSDIGKPNECNIPYSYSRPQCTCKKGFYYNDDNVCVPKEECPYFRCGGDRNTTYQECPSACPRTCEYPGGKGVCTAQCLKEGCQCKDGYLLDANGKCVQLQDCSGAKKCSANETFVYCKVGCPTNNCPLNDGLGMVACSPPFPCRSGCSCKADFLRDGSANDRCIKSSDCPPVNCTRPNEEWNPRIPPCPFNRCSDIGKPNECNRSYSYSRPHCTCKKGFYYNDDNVCVPKEECRCDILSECRPTCSNPSPKNCPSRELVTENIDVCKCKPGFILEQPDGICIRIEECPNDSGCNGDPNSEITQCPWPRSATCDSPNAGTDGKKCQDFGCQCKSGYILDRNTGKCILPDECEGGNPCGLNGTFSDCGFRCPNQNCPDESGLVIACKPGRPCPPGCLCKDDYKRNKDDFCILETDCPQCKVKPECRPTCAQPKPPKCDYVEPADTNIDGCNCQSGHILSESGGTCIKIEDCPTDIGCNGDPNAQAKQCPLPCPSTCDSPNATPCKKKCDPIGCECRPGYILSKINGKCIRADDCKGGNPCGPNATFVRCKFGCPTNYCPTDDSQATVICESYPFSPCYSGCACELNHRILSTEDPRCILSSECPPVNCTRRNEIWKSCPQECSSGYCEDVDKPPVICNTLVLNCNPKCMCKDGYYKNPADGVCVSAEKCRKLNKKRHEN